MKLLTFFIFLFAAFYLAGCATNKTSKTISDKSDNSTNYVEPLINSMSIEEKIAQLFVIRPEQIDPAISQEELHKTNAPHTTKITNEIRTNFIKYPVGGIAIFNFNIKSPEQLKTFNKDIHQLSEQTNSKIKPLIFIDEEGGKISRLSILKNFNLPVFGPMGTLTSENMPMEQRKAIYKNAGQTIGSYLKEYEIDVDFAPVFDVNTNPSNPVIGNRAFSSNPELAGELAMQFLYGLNENGIEGCLKHFPGHGDTSTDTHLGYSKIDKTKAQILECELLPFKYGIENGAKIIMTAHISLPNVTGNNLPSTLSPAILTDILRDQLGYEGLIITDAMEMGAIQKLYDSGTAAVMAIQAGADFILSPYDFYLAYDAVVNAVKTGQISESRINESVIRILKFKQNI